MSAITRNHNTVTVRNEVAKVMFLHVSLSHSVHGGCLGVLSQHALQVVSQHALQKGDLLGGWVLASGGLAPKGVPALWGLLLRGVCS